MAAWITSYGGTILVLAVIILMVVLCIRSLIKARKAGKSSCGAGCAHCPSAGMCAHYGERIDKKQKL